MSTELAPWLLSCLPFLNCAELMRIVWLLRRNSRGPDEILGDDGIRTGRSAELDSPPLVWHLSGLGDLGGGDGVEVEGRNVAAHLLCKVIPAELVGAL
jgi:hypothetical protein